MRGQRLRAAGGAAGSAKDRLDRKRKTLPNVEGLPNCLTLAGLAVHLRRVTTRAVLLQLKAIRRITTVLLGDVVTLLANLASEGDLGANVCRLASHWLFLTFGLVRSGIASSYL